MPSGYRWPTSHSRHVASSGNSRLNSMNEYRDSDEAARIGALRFVLPMTLIQAQDGTGVNFIVPTHVRFETRPMSRRPRAPPLRCGDGDLARPARRDRVVALGSAHGDDRPSA